MSTLSQYKENQAAAEGKYASTPFWPAYRRGLFCVFILGAYPFMVLGNITMAKTSKLVSAECPFHDIGQGANCTIHKRLPDMILDMSEKPESGVVLLIVLNLLLWSPLLAGLGLAAYWKAKRRALEGMGIEFVTLLVAGVAQAVTSVPDSTGTCMFVFDDGEACDTAGCKSTWSSIGAWILFRVSFDFCGDMIWSGHTERVVVGLTCVVRLMRDRYGEEWWSRKKIIVISIAVSYLIAVIGTILYAHFHYTVDILLGIFIPTILLTHEPFLKTMVSFLEETKLFPFCGGRSVTISPSDE